MYITESSIVYKEQNGSSSYIYCDEIQVIWLKEQRMYKYCFVCKLFLNAKRHLQEVGFLTWWMYSELRKITDRMEHNRVVLNWIIRKSNTGTVDQHLQEQIRKMQHNFELLKRVEAVIKFLTERDLAFRGHRKKWGSPNNGNFMGAIELIAELAHF